MSVSGYIANVQKKRAEEALKTIKIAEFRPGDTLSVKYRILDGSSQRVTFFEGICIKKRNKGLLSSFTLRRISSGVGVERTFLMYSPLIVEVSVVRHGAVRRAVLHYLRDVRGTMKVKERFVKKKSS